jgi:hypothetical protein
MPVIPFFVGMETTGKTVGTQDYCRKSMYLNVMVIGTKFLMIREQASLAIIGSLPLRYAKPEFHLDFIH